MLGLVLQMLALLLEVGFRNLGLDEYWAGVFWESCEIYLVSFFRVLFLLFLHTSSCQYAQYFSETCHPQECVCAKTSYAMSDVWICSFCTALSKELSPLEGEVSGIDQHYASLQHC